MKGLRDVGKKLQLEGLDGRQLLAVEEIRPLLQVCQDTVLRCAPSEDGRLTVRYDGKDGTLRFSTTSQLLRGCGLYCEMIAGGSACERTEKPAYADLGVMADCSRNAVPTVETVKKLCRHLSLMGYTSLQLYTEDTYEMPEYPTFGYLRGRYTREELMQMDTYASMLGIEIVPCIQTLAHLRQALRWDALDALKDCDDILLIDDEKTYAFIDCMFRTMSQSLKSRRINIGMDEAHSVGLGRFLAKNGYQDRLDVMLRHFNRVMEIARRYGYQPMMWSDMFFRLASAGEYYNPDCPLRADVIEKIPKDVTLVYWDYYTTEKKGYDGMLQKHRELCPNVAFAGGAWKWTGFGPENDFSRVVGLPAHESCKEHGIKQVLITAWGDNGAEAPLMCVLPSLQLWAELCYEDNGDAAHVARRFCTCTGGASYDDFMALDAVRYAPDNTQPGIRRCNPSKYLLYQDLLYGLFDRHVQPREFAVYYGELAQRLSGIASSAGEWAYLFETQGALLSVLELKSGAGVRIRRAYECGDRVELRRIAQEELPILLQRLQRFVAAFHAQWTRENKIFGLDMFDLRIGGLRQRILTAQERIGRYCDGEIGRLEELEERLLCYSENVKELESVPHVYFWDQMCSPSVLTGP